MYYYSVVYCFHVDPVRTFSDPGPVETLPFTPPSGNTFGDAVYSELLQKKVE